MSTRTRTRSPARGRTRSRQTRPRQHRLRGTGPAAFVLAVLLGAFVFLVLPTGVDARQAGVTVVARPVLAGLVAGLTWRQGNDWLRAGAGLLAAALGTEVLVRTGTTPGHLALAAVLLAPLAASLAALLTDRYGARVAESVGVAAVLGHGLFLSGVAATPHGQHPVARQAALAAPPVPGHYTAPGEVYLRIVDLMKHGTFFYPAYRRAILGLKGQGNSSLPDPFDLTTRRPWSTGTPAPSGPTSMPSPFDFREPFLFHLWRLLPGSTPYALLAWFVVFGLAAGICAYLLARTFTGPGPALVAPVTLVAYLDAFWWSDGSLWFTLPEVWAGLFAIAALMCLVRGWRLPGLLLVLVAVATREFMLVLVVVWVVTWLGTARAERRRTWWEPALAVGGSVLLVGSAWLMAPAGGGHGAGADRWLHGGAERLLAALRFGWDATPAPATTSLVVAGLALLGALLTLPAPEGRALTLAVVLPLAFLTAFSPGSGGDYWGVAFVPVFIALVPLAAGRWVGPA